MRCWAFMPPPEPMVLNIFLIWAYWAGSPRLILLSQVRVPHVSPLGAIPADSLGSANKQLGTYDPPGPACTIRRLSGPRERPSAILSTSFSQPTQPKRLLRQNSRTAPATIERGVKQRSSGITQSANPFVLLDRLIKSRS